MKKCFLSNSDQIYSKTHKHTHTKLIRTAIRGQTNDPSGPVSCLPTFAGGNCFRGNKQNRAIIKWSIPCHPVPASNDLSKIHWLLLTPTLVQCLFGLFPSASHGSVSYTQGLCPPVVAAVHKDRAVHKSGSLAQRVAPVSAEAAIPGSHHSRYAGLTGLQIRCCSVETC